MPKVLHIIPSLQKGGAERLVLDIISELRKRDNVDARLATFRPLNSYAADYPEIQPTVIPATVRALVLGKWKINVQELQTYIDDFQPDVIHTHLFEAEFVSRCVNYPKAKWFSHCHDNMRQFRNFAPSIFLEKQKLTEFYEKRCLLRNYKRNGGTHFIAISEDTRKYFESTIPKYPITLLHNAINCQAFAGTQKHEHSSSVLKIVNTGSFQAKKNQKLLIEIAKVLQARNVDFEIHFLGDGQERNNVENAVEEACLQKHIVFHGNVDNVSRYLQSSDIYVHTATYEPFGLVLIEAMAAGVPVVCLDASGNRDIMENGRNGYIIAEQNAEIFADRILEIWQNPQKYNEMSAYAQQFARKYDIKEFVDRLLELYETET